MERTIEDIVEELVDLAQGIFLWAHLVLDAIRQDIRRRFSVARLKAKMREYPSELDGLYDKLREPIVKSPMDRKLSNRMLLLAAPVPKDFPLFALVFSWLPEDDQSGLLDPSFPPSIKCQPYSEQDVAERLQIVAERINGLTRGLLEVYEEPRAERQIRHSSPKVRFCHRTARDYLIANSKRYAVLEESWPGFHQSDPYGRIYLAQLIYGRNFGHFNASEYLNMPFCRSFSLDTIRKFETPLQPLLYPMWISNAHGYGTGSFLHYAAYCGLDTFVLSEVANESGVCLPSPGTSILLTSMYFATKDNGNHDLALDLLQSQTIRDDVIKANVVAGYNFGVYEGKTLPVWPIWVTGLIYGLQQFVFVLHPTLNSFLKRGSQPKVVDDSLLKVCRLLEELGVELGHNLSVRVGLVRNNGRNVYYFLEGTLITFSADQLLKLAEHLKAGAVSLFEEEVQDEWCFNTICGVLRMERLMGSYKWDIASWKLDSPTESVTVTKSHYGTLNFRLF